MRFGSTREMLQHYASDSEDEALRKLCVERDLNEREVLRRARGLQSAEALNNAVKKANAFLTYASPYGYDYVDGVLQVKNEEARVVSLILALPRGQRHRQDLPRTQPGRIPHEDRSGLGEPNDREHPQQSGVLRPGAPERRHQTREARASDRDRHVQPGAA